MMVTLDKIAKAMCESDGAKWDAATSNETANGETPEEQREYWREKARIALTAARAEPVAIERLKAAVEGECNGLAIDDDQARNILDYLHPAPAEAPERQVVTDGFRAYVSHGTAYCASEDCDNQATVHFIAGGVGSFYCDDCYSKIRALAPAPQTEGE